MSRPGDVWVHDGPGHEGCPGRGDVWVRRHGYWEFVERIELPACTSTDPDNHQGDTCPVHEAPSRQRRPSPIGYSEGPPVKVRVFSEGDHWAIDWADAVGNYSEVVWTGWDDGDGRGFVEYATREDALRRVPAFIDDAALPAGLPLEVEVQRAEAKEQP